VFDIPRHQRSVVAQGERGDEGIGVPNGLALVFELGEQPPGELGHVHIEDQQALGLQKGNTLKLKVGANKKIELRAE